MPKRKVETVSLEQAAIDALSKEYKTYIDEVKFIWLAEHRSRSEKVYEVMAPLERQKIHKLIAEWKRYVTPLAEVWWKTRGYGIIWPPQDSEPMQTFKLGAA